MIDLRISRLPTNHPHLELLAAWSKHTTQRFVDTHGPLASWPSDPNPMPRFHLLRSTHR